MCPSPRATSKSSLISYPNNIFEYLPLQHQLITQPSNAVESKPTLRMLNTPLIYACSTCCLAVCLLAQLPTGVTAMNEISFDNKLKSFSQDCQDRFQVCKDISSGAK